jgi:gliding motility-associated-like protein
MNAQQKIALLFLMFCVAFLPSLAQKRYNVWAFGKQGGINFNTTPPSGFKSKSPERDPPYYLSSICDTSGELMFYTDGLTVYNRDGFKMPKYNNWWPLAGNVMPLVCPRPGSDTLFYLFAISDAANPYELQAFPLRLKAPGDLDEMIYPRPTGPNNFQKRLKKKCSMIVAGTAHCNQKDYWISTYSDHALYSFLVTAAGINEVPVVTTVPENIILDSTVSPGLSNMKFSANGEKAVVPNFDENKVVVFDFDNATGKFSNPLKIGVKDGLTLEEADLSPDGSKLYLATKYSENDGRPITYHDIGQMDLNAGTTSAIENTFVILTPIADLETCNRATCFFVYRTINVGPDGRMYIGMRYATRATITVDESFSIIEAPNTAGVNCLYKKAHFNVGSKYLFAGYNYVRSSSYTLKENGITVNKQNCADKPVQFGVLFSKVDSVRWDFGDPASGANNVSTSLNPSHQYPAPGSYTVKAIIYSKCIADTATSFITIKPDVSVKVPAQIKDTSICVGDILTLNARDGTSNAYQWENGLILADRTINEAGHYKVMIMNDCSLDMKEFDVTYDRCPCAVYVPTAFTPNDDGLNDVFKPATQCYAKQYKFTVFNRFGQVIFTSTDPQKGWDGFVGPYRQSTGTFIWTLQYQDPNSKKINFEKGTVLLIR